MSHLQLVVQNLDCLVVLLVADRAVDHASVPPLCDNALVHCCYALNPKDSFVIAADMKCAVFRFSVQKVFLFVKLFVDGRRHGSGVEWGKAEKKGNVFYLNKAETDFLLWML